MTSPLDRLALARRILERVAARDGTPPDVLADVRTVLAIVDDTTDRLTSGPPANTGT